MNVSTRTKATVATLAATLTVLLLAGAGCAKEAANDAQVNGGQKAATNSVGTPSGKDAANPQAPNPNAPPNMPGRPPMPPGADQKPTGSGDPNDSMCNAKDGTAISLGEAKRLGKAGDCGPLLGDFEGGGSCNYLTETWWVTIIPKKGSEKAGCNPACVVNVKTKKVEINWRCTGAIPPK